MHGTMTAKQVVTNPYFSLICFLAMTYLLPQFGGIAVMVGCAGLLSILIAVSPDQYRTRNGSLWTAIGLLAAMWIGAALITAMILTGAVRG